MNVDEPEYGSQARTKEGGRPPNMRLLLAGCFLRARRCRALAARTLAADPRVGYTKLMTIPSKGTRKVTVAGIAYAWHVRRTPTYSEGAFQTPMRVAIQRCDDRPCNVLLVSLGVSRPDNWIAPHQTSLTPTVVRSIIKAALEAGWDPSHQGPTFYFEYRLILDRP